MDLPEIAELDELAGRAIPPSLVSHCEGWLLRASTDAHFRRANSVLPNGEVSDPTAAIEAVERFCAEHGFPARFQISPAAQPETLDARLAARGYEIEAPVVVACAEAGAVTAALAATAGAGATGSDTGSDTEAVTAISERWASVHASGYDDRSRDRLLAYGRVLARVEHPAVAVLSPSGAAPAASLGFAVADSGWTGIFGMTTRPEARRRGAATAVLHGIAAWAVDQHAPRLYLQVEVENAPARALYARAGFTDAYGYHYRTRATQG